MAVHPKRIMISYSQHLSSLDLLQWFFSEHKIVSLHFRMSFLLIKVELITVHEFDEINRIMQRISGNNEVRLSKSHFVSSPKLIRYSEILFRINILKKDQKWKRNEILWSWRVRISEKKKKYLFLNSVVTYEIIFCLIFVKSLDVFNSKMSCLIIDFCT